MRDSVLGVARGRVQLFAAERLGVVPGRMHARDIRVRADICQLHGVRRSGQGTERPAPAVAVDAWVPAYRAGAGRLGVLARPHISERQGLRVPATPQLHRVPAAVLRRGRPVPVLLQPRRAMGGHHRTGSGQEHQAADLLNGISHTVFPGVRRVRGPRVFLRVRRPQPQTQSETSRRPSHGRRWRSGRGW